MKRHLLTLFLLGLTAIMAPSCGTSAKRTLSNTHEEHAEVVISDTEMVIYPDDHTRSKKNADRIFESWLDSRGMRRSVTGKRLMAIAPKSDGCRLTYDFRMYDGTQQRVTLNVKNYSQQYRKKRKGAPQQNNRYR